MDLALAPKCFTGWKLNNAIMHFKVQMPGIDYVWKILDELYSRSLYFFNRLNITNTIRKFSIDPRLRHKAIEFHSEPVPHVSQHGDEVDDEAVEGSVSLNSDSFAKLSQEHPILVVNFFAPWCYWSTRLDAADVVAISSRSSWEKAAKIIKGRYNPDKDGRIILAKVDCTEAADLCKRHHVQGYPSIRIFRKGSDLRDDDGHEHESYYGDRDTDALVKAMEELVSPTPLENQKLALEKNRPAPLTGGCRIEGYVRVKKVIITIPD
ncbi:protein disulfide-isomerase 5-3 [Gossypium australe]|uniref:protein disulfide-isomerase n=1 Tax=Gossypium australe TaxID=47621 RepID=A0A5B6VR84_9ROSI|nr:protein disulfide-isomerase 5-3 [Gossypium australe]